MTTIQCQRDHGRRSIRAGMFVSIVLRLAVCVVMRRPPSPGAGPRTIGDDRVRPARAACGETLVRSRVPGAAGAITAHLRATSGDCRRASPAPGECLHRDPARRPYRTVHPPCRAVRRRGSAKSMVLIGSDQKSHAYMLDLLCVAAPAGRQSACQFPSHNPSTGEMFPISRLLAAGSSRTKLVALTAFLVRAAGAVAIAAPNGLLTQNSAGPQGVVAVGPVNASNGFPDWYRDTNGVDLMPCNDPQDK